MAFPWSFSLGRRRRHEHILIACFPKSGSTYLSKVLREMTGLAKAYVSEPGPQNEQDISARRLTALRRRSVMQQHVKGTCTNVELLAAFGMRPIVQTRNLFDVVVSLHDHFQHNRHSLPCGYISRDYLRMGWDERVDYLTHVHLAWYFNFVLSWHEAAEELPIYQLSYEQLFANQPRELTRIADCYGLSVRVEDIKAAIDRAAHSDTRFNVGIAGRGREMLSRQAQETIRRLAAKCRIDVEADGTLAPRMLGRSLAA